VKLKYHKAFGRPTLLAILVVAACLAACETSDREPAHQADTAGIAVVPAFRTIVERVSNDSIISALRALESLGVKEPGTQALTETADWLQAKYESYGYSDIVRHDFTFETHNLQNIIVTKTGSRKPAKFLVLTGHYDTIVGPGVNDNGSGIAILLEVARVLADVETDISIRFINFSAEEEGLIGSTAYVSDVVAPEATDILLVLNIDEVGGIASAANTTITCERDEGSIEENNAASAAYTDTLAALTRAYSSLETRIDHAYGSDYLPFESEGYVITGFYEANESSLVHTPDDVLANMDPAYVAEITRATVAAALHFAGAGEL
jgi:hypothetical protein